MTILLNNDTGVISVNGDNYGPYVANIKDFGAVADNSTDNASAFASAVAALPSVGGVVYIPEGYYVFNSQLTVTNKSIAIIGAGINTTVLRWPAAAATVGISISQNDDNYGTAVKDLSLHTNKAAVGTSLTIDLSGQISGGLIQQRHTPRIVIENVESNGASNSASDGWLRGIDLTAPIHVTIKGYHFIGKVTSTFDNIDSEYGIYIHGSGSPVEILIQDSWAFYVGAAVYSIDTEGVIITGCNFIAVTYGVHVPNTGAKPHLVIANCHMNVFSRCIIGTSIQQALIHDNLFYARNDAVANVTGIDVNTMTNSHIHDNVFVNTSGTYDFNTIVLQNGCTDNFVNHNIFRSANTAINLQAGSASNSIGRNIFQTVSTEIVDSGSNNIQEAAVGIDDIIEDTSPQLGGNLDVNNQSIVSVSNGNVTIAPDGTGKTVVSSNVGVGDSLSASNMARTFNICDSGTIVRLLRVGGSFFPSIEFMKRATADAVETDHWDITIDGNYFYFRNRIGSATAVLSLHDSAPNNAFAVEDLGQLRLIELSSSPGTPASGFGELFCKTDGKLYFKNSAGTETALT